MLISFTSLGLVIDGEDLTVILKQAAALILVLELQVVLGEVLLASQLLAERSVRMNVPKRASDEHEQANQLFPIEGF